MDFVTKRGNIRSFAQLVELIVNRQRKQATFLIGIDGCGGSGKSTFARRLYEKLQDATLIHFDDFYLPSSQISNADPRVKPIGSDFDWERLLEEVIRPLKEDKEGCYQRYDWDTDALAEWHTVPIGGIVIIEGVYSTRDEIVDNYDLTIFVDSPRDVRLARGLERDGEAARDMWEKNWMVAEKLYVEKQRPDLRADIVIDGTK